MENLSECVYVDGEYLATPDMIKDEAIKRMRKLGIMDQVVEEFKNEKVVEYSEPMSFGSVDFGALYWLHNKPEWLEKITAFEREFECLVYHVIYSYTSFGELLNVLYVSNYPEEWEMDNADLDEGYAMAYVINLTHPDCSEFGTIEVKEEGGGLLRVG